MIRLDTLNVRLGRAGGLEASLWDMKQGNVDMGVLQETNLMDGITSWKRAVYDIWETAAGIRHQGGGGYQYFRGRMWGGRWRSFSTSAQMWQASC